MKSFLLIGQSNMAGRGFKHEVPPIYNERIMMLRNGRWQMMTEPIHFDKPVAGVGLAASFAESWCKMKEKRLALFLVQREAVPLMSGRWMEHYFVMQ